jgi:hypothetical protein
MAVPWPAHDQLCKIWAGAAGSLAGWVGGWVGGWVAAGLLPIRHHTCRIACCGYGTVMDRSHSNGVSTNRPNALQKELQNHQPVTAALRIRMWIHMPYVCCGGCAGGLRVQALRPLACSCPSARLMGTASMRWMSVLGCTACAHGMYTNLTNRLAAMQLVTRPASTAHSLLTSCAYSP